MTKEEIENDPNYPKNWTQTDGETIDMPDYLEPLFNKIGTQFRFVTVSGKNESLATCHCVRSAEEFFYQRRYNQEKELSIMNQPSRKELYEALKELHGNMCYSSEDQYNKINNLIKLYEA